MQVVIEAFNKDDELLAFEIKVSEKYVNKLVNNLNFSEADKEFLMSGAGGFDLNEKQVKQIENIINKEIFSNNYDFQIGTS